jgi:hypothetical protein
MTKDKLYALNRFFHRSADLVLQPSLDRPLLVATALMNSALSNFQRSALLLADHIDVRYERVQVVQLDGLNAENNLSTPSQKSDCRKRRRRIESIMWRARELKENRFIQMH